jgi:EAL domain-containing protein (putative c-di-GMP-specific phosphodiesterase class I)
MAGIETRPNRALPTDPLSAAVMSRDRDVPLMVREALAAGRTQLAFQPIVAAGPEGRIAFYEGFIRLLDDGNRILPAGSFISTVEETEMGREIDCAALRLGLKMLRANPRIRLAINMSARSIGDGAWRRELELGLARDPAVGARLILEMSESSAMQLPEVVTRFMAEMQPKGITFALDDFGAGLTAFRYLKDFLFDMVKVDSLFVKGIDQTPDHQVIAEALIMVAHQFEMFAIAEGVETAAEAQVLTALGVDCLQGWLYGVPKPTL